MKMPHRASFTSKTFAVTALITLGLGSSAAVFTFDQANTVGGTSRVTIGTTTNATGETMPVVTVTAKKLTVAQKVVLVMLVMREA